MSDLARQLIVIVVGALVSGGGIGAVWLQARASRAAGVKAADVDQNKSAGELALDIAERADARMEAQGKRIDELETVARETRADLDLVRGELRSVLAEVESIARDLRRFVEWEDAGAHGNPPISLSDIYQRLEALNRRNKHHE